MIEKFHYHALGDEKKTQYTIIKFKYYILAVPIVLATLLLLLVNIGVEITFQTPDLRLTWSRGSGYRFNDDTDRSYFIKTEGCTIPGFDPFDPSVVDYYETVKPILCHNSSSAPLVESNSTHLWVIEEHLENYHVYQRDNLRCCYRPFYRPGVEISISDDRHIYREDCIRFEEAPAKIEDEFVRVECSHNGTEIYKDFHSFVIPKVIDGVDTEHGDRFNVLVLGIDAVSRLNFHRTMPKTLNYLRKLDAIDMKGYNKVGDNTYPNLVPVLSGLNETELNSVCYGHHMSRFDDCPFIWKSFARSGYLTGLAEDAASIAVFNYLKSGFVLTPTDYYWRTFDNTAEEEMGHEKRLNAYLCVGPRMTVDLLLAYVYKFVKSLSERLYFGFFWETSLTHDNLNYPSLADEKYSDLLEMMYNESLMDRTVLVMLSDHGIRWGQIRMTHQGRIEERLPFLYLVLPSVFKEKYPLATSNMRRNAKRLSTPFDLHETFVDLLDPVQLQDESLRERTSNGSYESFRGISLFLPIGSNRTCQSAGIGPHWCTCHDTKNISRSDETVLKVAGIVVDHMNEMMRDYVQCSTLNLTEVVDARISEPFMSSQVNGVKHVVNDYTVVVRTQPGDGLFESTVRHTPSGWNVTGTVSRINLMVKKSNYCVDDFHLKLYCYCDNPLSRMNMFR